MPSISTDTRVFLWVVAAIAGALSAIIGNELAKNIVYFFSRRGRPPTRRPIRVWAIFSLSLAISIISGAFAAFAPAPAYSTNNIRLVPIGDRNIAVKLGNESLSPGIVIPLNTTITVTFKILNDGISPITVKALVIGSRGPGVNCENPNIEKWSAPDIPFPMFTDITIRPGGEYEYQGSRSFYLPGEYFLEPIIQGPSGNWGGIQPFSCLSITVARSQPSQTKTPTLTATFTPAPIVTELSVFAAQYPFSSTGITVMEGDKVTITATGQWDCGRGSLVGPDGYVGEQYSDHVFPNAPACALIGGIASVPPTEGFDGYFLIGTKGTWTAQAAGKLYLGCNDAIQSFNNPTDSKLEVKIVIEKQTNP